MNSLLNQPKWNIGTMGFSYKDWKGVFYPDNLPQPDYIKYYSRIFNCAEIDSTFYGTPRKTSIHHWFTSTPDDFRFCLKVPRIITHEMKLITTISLMQEFVDVSFGLGDKLGVLLLQFPPSFSSENMQSLEQFFSELPVGPRYAIEIRDSSWYQEQSGFEELLKRYQICWASTEYPGLPARILPVTDFLYIRWIGQHGTFKHHHSERIDRSSELSWWYKAIMNASSGIMDIYGFFNNDYAGYAAGTALRFKKLAGLPGDLTELPRQARLL